MTRLATYPTPAVPALALAIALTLTTAVCAQLSNDDCLSALDLGVGPVATTWDNSMATPDGPAWVATLTHCGLNWNNGIVADMWFTWSPGPATYAAEFSLCTPGATSNGILNSDNKIVVYDTTACVGLTPANIVACDDDGCTSISFGLQAVATGFVTPGHAYLIQAGSYSTSSTGTWNLAITPRVRTVANFTCVLGPGPDDYVVQFDYPPGSGPGDTVTITSTETGAANPVAVLSYPTNSYVASLLPSNQGSSQMFEVSAVYHHSGLTSQPESCLLWFYPELRDACWDAMLIGVGDVDVPFDSATATTGTEPSLSCALSHHNVGFSDDLWGLYVATEPFTLITFPSATSAFRSVAMYRNCSHAVSGSAIDCKRFPSSGPSQFVVETVPGDTYTIRVGSSWNSAPSTLQIRAIPPLPNDECMIAQFLGTGALTTTIATAGATTGLDPDPHGCHVPGSYSGDVWYSWTAADERAFIEWEAALDLDEPIVAVYESCADAAAGIAVVCDSDEPAVVALLTTPGQSYLLRLGSTRDPTGVGELRITAVGPLTNDDCASALPLGVGSGTWDVSNIGATSIDPPATDCPSYLTTGLSNIRDVYYSWVADAEIAEIEWSVGLGIGRPIVMVYSDCSAAASGDVLDCYADFDGPALLMLPTIPGQTYLLRLGDNGHPWTGGISSLSITTGPSVANDECATATHLGTGNHTVTVDLTADASTGWDPTPAGCANFQRDRWYSWVAHTPFIELRWVALPGGNAWRPSLAVYGSCSDAQVGTSLICEWSATGSVVLSEVGVNVGQTYWIRLGHGLGDPGVGEFEIRGQQLGTQDLVCSEGLANGLYELNWTAPPAVLPGDSFVVTSNEVGVNNPIYVGSHGSSPTQFLSQLLPSNQGFTLSVTFAVVYTTAVGVGVSQCAVVFEQVPGDDCIDAVPIGTGEVVVPFSLVGTTLSPEPQPIWSQSSCWFGSLDQDLWFEWTADWEWAQFTIEAMSPIRQPAFAIYETCADAAVGDVVACGSGHGVEMSVAWDGFTVGATYLIRVGRSFGGAGSAVLTIEDVAWWVPALSCEAAPSTLNRTGISLGQQSALLRWSWPLGSAVGDMLEISSDEPGVTNPVRVVHYPVDSAPYHLQPANAGQPLAVEFGVTYVTGPASSTHTQTCAFSFGTLGHDECGNALAISGLLPIEQVVDLRLATESPEVDVSNIDCGFPTSFNEDAWLQWTATAEQVRISWTSSIMRDPTLAIYDSCQDAAAGMAVGCNDGEPYESEIEFNAVLGQTYWIRVADHDSDHFGEGLLEIETRCAAPSHGAVEYDCMNQVVTLSWTEQEDYTAFELLVNGVPVQSPPTPMGLGSSNSYVDVVPLLNTTMTYELRATCPGR